MRRLIFLMAFFLSLGASAPAHLSESSPAQKPQSKKEISEKKVEKKPHRFKGEVRQEEEYVEESDEEFNKNSEINYF